MTTESMAAKAAHEVSTRVLFHVQERPLCLLPRPRKAQKQTSCSAPSRGLGTMSRFLATRSQPGKAAPSKPFLVQCTIHCYLDDHYWPLSLFLVVALHGETVPSYAESTKFGALIGTALLAAWPKSSLYDAYGLQSWTVIVGVLYSRFFTTRIIQNGIFPAGPTGRMMLGHFRHPRTTESMSIHRANPGSP